MKQLRNLDISQTKINGTGLVHLKDSANLRELVLYDTGVTDASLSAVGQWPRLECLNLAATPITDAGLAHLKDLKDLQ